MEIRHANINEIEDIVDVYGIAKETMNSIGNTKQWTMGYPYKEMVLEDIKNNNLYVITSDNTICGVFTFIIGNDPTYDYIEGAWICDTLYGTIHRIASNNKVKGIFKAAIDFANSKIKHLRIDTHEDNIIMRNVILKNGFKECGIIYTREHSPRIAYERID